MSLAFCILSASSTLSLTETQCFPGISFFSMRPSRDPSFLAGVGVGFAASRLGDGEGEGEGSGVGSAVGLGLATTMGSAGVAAFRERTASVIPISNTAATTIAIILKRFFACAEPVREREILGKGSLAAAVFAPEP
jgi:hypothetical protein